MKFQAKYLKSDSWVIPTFAVAQVNDWDIEVRFGSEGDPTGPDDSEDIAESTGYDVTAWPVDRSQATYRMVRPEWVNGVAAAMIKALEAAPAHMNINRMGILEIEA
jgi:hypothetical protein